MPWANPEYLRTVSCVPKSSPTHRHGMQALVWSFCAGSPTHTYRHIIAMIRSTRDRMYGRESERTEFRIFCLLIRTIWNSQHFDFICLKKQRTQTKLHIKDWKIVQSQCHKKCHIQQKGHWGHFGNSSTWSQLSVRLDILLFYCSVMIPIRIQSLTMPLHIYIIEPCTLRNAYGISSPWELCV